MQVLHVHGYKLAAILEEVIATLWFSVFIKMITNSQTSLHSHSPPPPPLGPQLTPREYGTFHQLNFLRVIAVSQWRWDWVVLESQSMNKQGRHTRVCRYSDKAPSGVS